MLTLLFLTILSASSNAQERQLRLWIMNNEPGSEKVEITEKEILKATEALKRSGITIENSVKNLLMPAEHKYPMASQILGENSFVRRLSEEIGKHPELGKVAIEFLRWDDAYSRMSSALASNDIETQPDVIQVGLSWANDFAEEGKLISLDGKIEKDGFYPAWPVNTSFDAPYGFYAVPWFLEARLLYYRTDSVPNHSMIANWDSFARTCKDYSERTGTPFIGFSTAINWNLLHNLAPWLWSAGGDIVKAPSGWPLKTAKAALTEPGSISAMIYLKNLSESGCAHFSNSPQEVIDRDFAKGRYAAIITGPWIRKILATDSSHKIASGGIPDGGEGSATFIGGSHLAVSKASTARGNEERAIALVKLLTSPKLQTTMNETTGLYPVNNQSIEAITSSPDIIQLHESIRRHLTYPDMKQWGEIIENEFIRTHLWHIWRDIAQGVPDETLISTTKNASRQLERRIIASEAVRLLPHIAIFAILSAALTGLAVFFMRLKHKKTRLLHEKLSAEMIAADTEKTILKAQTEHLRIIGEERSSEMLRLHKKLEDLTLKTEELKEKISKTDALRQGDEKKIGQISISWDGVVSIRGKTVKFENNRQAKRLIEHLVRSAGAGKSSVHCIWGYPLFGWKKNSLSSHPQRLFEIMAAKINSCLRQHGAPPIIKKTSKGSHIWRLSWDVDYTISCSDTYLASKTAEAYAEKKPEDCISPTLEMLRIDPLNADAMAFARRLTDSKSLSQTDENKLKSLLNKGRKILSQRIETFAAGVREVEDIMINNSLPKGMEAADIQEEILLMRHLTEAIEHSLILAGNDSVKTPEFSLAETIRKRMSEVHDQIISSKSNLSSQIDIWASAVSSDSFIRLISTPQISHMTNNFYNTEIGENENPRLVQLALIAALSKKSSLDSMNEGADPLILLKNISRHVQKELHSLSSGLEIIN